MFTTLVVSIVAGVLSGFAVSYRTPAAGLEDLTRNMLVGTVGAFVGLQIVGKLVDSPEAGASAIALTVASLIGASIALFLINRLRKA